MIRYVTLALICALCCASPSHAAALTVEVVDSSGKPVPDAVVYADSGAAPAQPASHAPIYIEQKNKTFIPFVSVIPVGTRAYFPNHDGIGHHVYSFSPVKTFELPLSDKENSESILFDKTGVVTVGCNIHDWMVAYVYILATPYYALTNSEGKADIADIAAGDYQVHVWHPGIAGADTGTSVTIAADDPAALHFTIALKPEYFWRPPRPANEETY
jgi:plastocyanin